MRGQGAEAEADQGGEQKKGKRIKKGDEAQVTSFA